MDWHASRPPLDIFVFSDGTLIDDRAGAGYSIYRGCTQEIGRGSLPLGQSAEIYDAEVAGATEGLSATLRNPMAYYASNITICLKNQEAALRLLSDPPTRTSLPYISMFRKLALSWKEMERSPMTNQGALDIRWCPGHVGIPGNEAADALAKSACAVPTPFLPPSIARAKRIIKINYETSVASYWAQNAPERYKKLGIGPKSHISFELARLSRRALGSLFAARLGHGDFANYHRRFHHDSTLLTCACGDEKTPDHFFFCRLGRQRGRLPGGPRHPSTGIRWALGSADGAVAFGKWLTTTLFFDKIQRH
ncbi:hypothetical protein K3495_g2711 [Podosphaera aphanis]|nr:hypothetical protein K3495_g2711 [Podosphaera aphanis]